MPISTVSEFCPVWVSGPEGRRWYCTLPPEHGGNCDFGARPYANALISELRLRAERAERQAEALRERLKTITQAAEGERLTFKGTLWEELLRARHFLAAYREGK